MKEIKVGLILEILGRPEQHVVDSLNALVARLGAEKGVKIASKEVHEPRKIDESKDLFTTFADVEIDFDSLDDLFRILFAYLPSNVEAIHPEKITISNMELSDVSSKIVQRLHEYDALAKNFLMERELILEELKKSAPDIYQKLTTPKENLSKK